MATPGVNCCYFQWGLIGINSSTPIDSCPAIIQQVADISYAVDGTAAGQLTVVEYIDGNTGNQVLLVYEWDGADWVLQIDTNAKVIDGEFAIYGISIDAGTWEVSVDGGVSWTDSDFIFDPPVSSFSVQFRNTVTGCTYSGWNMAFPLDINYCVIWSTWNNDEDPAFFVGTISGQSTGESLFILMGFNGNPTASYIYDASTYFFMSVYDSSTPAATNFGLYSNEFTDPPIVNMPVPIQNTSCERNCYRAVFTVEDLSTQGLTAITSFNNAFTYDVQAPDFEVYDLSLYDSHDIDLLKSVGFLEPAATLTYELNGLEITMTICTIMQLEGSVAGWGTISTNDGNATFTKL